MLRVISFKFTDQELAAVAFRIREKVFVEEQKVSREEEYDSHEEEAIHFLVYADGIPAGTARWRKTDKGVKLERFAVLPEHRNKGAGMALVNAVLNDVLPLNEPVYLNAQLSAVGLYKKAGFREEGELFYEANIPHYRMVLVNENR
jgi:predicted GNAT family N-acyltransferase